MPLVALPHDLPAEDIEGGKQISGPVPPIVVGRTFGDSLAQREDRLGSIQRLDLGLLMHAEHQGVLGRIEVESDDVPKLFFEVLIGAELVVLQSVGLEPTGSPDLM